MKTVDNCIEKGYHVHSRKLGEGGFGVVKLATHLATNQKVAVKIINKQKIGKDLFRVKTEITALRVLRHKNIAQLLQVIENEHFIYLIMEYCSGGELFDYLVSRKRLTENEAFNIFLSLVQVLAYIHAKGFAHRDIKPENILLDENHRIKLIDFGLAASSDMSPSGDLTGLSTCCGSPAYVAPELLEGHKYSGPAADVWSTGVLYYTLLVGSLPFHDTNLAVLYKHIKECNFVLPRFLSPRAKHLISKMLNPNPQTRITLQGIMDFIGSTGYSSRFVNTKLSLAELSLKQEESEIDENILLKCAALFPDYKDLNTLSDKILNNYGYHTASYWLVKQNPTNFKDLENLVRKETISRRRSRSFSEFKSPKLKKVAMTDISSKAAASPVINEASSESVSKVVEECKRIPEIKPKPKMPNTDVKVFDHKKTERVVQKRSIPISKKLFGAECEPVQSKATPEASFAKPTGTVFNGNILNSDDNKENNSPFKNKSLDQAKLNSDPNETATPKKSLIKRFLESATPRKCQSPRRFSMNDKNVQSNNIMLTNYTNVDLCMAHIVKLLSAKHVNCKIKNYSIRCVLSSMNVIIVAFELEILICRATGFVAIQRKRIRGTSWDYVKICEELTKVIAE